MDGFHPINVGKTALVCPLCLCYPAGILELLKRYNIETKANICVVLGRSNIVGKPMAQLMMLKAGDATRYCVP